MQSKYNSRRRRKGELSLNMNNRRMRERLRKIRTEKGYLRRYIEETDRVLWDCMKDKMQKRIRSFLRKIYLFC